MMRFVVLALCVVAASLSVFAQPGGPDIKVDVVAEQFEAPPGEVVRYAIRIKVPEGWHINANEPLEEFLIPTAVTIEGSDTVVVDQIVYPEAEVMNFAFSEEPMAVYEGEVLIGVALRINEDAPNSETSHAATLRYQACNDSACWAPQNVAVELPVKIALAADETREHTDVFAAIEFGEGETTGSGYPVLATMGGGRGGPEISVQGVASATGVHPGGSIDYAVVVALPEGWHVNSHTPLEEFLKATRLEIDVPHGITVAEIAYPEHKLVKFAFSDKPVAVYEGAFPIGVRIDVGQGVAVGERAIGATLFYQACDDKSCAMPTSGEFVLPLNVVEADVEIQHEDLFASIAFTGAATPVAPDLPDEVAPVAVDSDAWRDSLPTFSIAGQTGGLLYADKFLEWVEQVESGTAPERPVGFAASVKSLFGGSFSFAGMGMPLIIILTLIGGLALNLTPCVLPMIPINLAIIGAGAQAGSRGKGFGLGGVYGLGIALVYGVLGLIVVFGLGTFGTINASPWFNFGIAALFVVLALAMFDLILIDFSKYQTRLGIKKDQGSFLFAFIMGAVCALLAGACVAPVVIAVVLYAQDIYAEGNVVGLFLPFLLGVGMALPWPFAGAGLSMMPKPGMWMVRVKQAFGVFILLFAAYYGYQGYTILSERFVDRDAVIASVDESGWVMSLSDGLAIAERENKPVIIDFWATWCKNCLTMNETTFKNETVLEKLDGYVKVKYQAEDPDSAPAKDVLGHFEYVGLPHYAILYPAGHTP